MDINLTLLGQMITFAVFVWFTMKYIWPVIMKAMQEREKRLADGIAAADKAQRDLELAQHKSVQMLQEAKVKAAHIVEDANNRFAKIVEEAKEAARTEGAKLITHAETEIDQIKQQAKAELQTQTVELAVAIAEKIMKKNIDPKTNKELLAQSVMET